MGHAVIFAALLLASGCSGGDEAPSSAAAGEDGGGGGPTPDGGSPDSAPTEAGAAPPDAGSASWTDPLPEPLAWEPCPLFSGAERGGDAAPPQDAAAGAADPAFYDKDAECALTRMPLFHQRAGSETIPYFVKRLRASAPRRGQVWLLAGGPGSSGQNLEGLAWLVSEQIPDLDVYLPDHRGTGGSSAVDCPITKSHALGGAPPQSCANEILAATEHLEAYRTTEASYDVLRLMQATREGDEPLFVFGGSYGGTWAHRMLAIAPDLMAGTVLDGTARPIGEQYFTSTIEGRDAVGRRLLALCEAQPECASHFDTLDFDALSDRVRALPMTCPELTEDIVQVEVALTGALESFSLKRLTPAALHHLTSCTPEGMRWFAAFMTEARRRGAAAGPGPSFSDGLFINVGTAEVWGAGVGANAFDTAAATTLFGRGAANSDLNELLGWYPTYPDDEYTGVWAETRKPLLILHGELDPRVDVAAATEAAEQLSVPPGFTFRFPTGGHVVTVASHAFDDQITCGAHLAMQFLRDPTAEIDATCLDEAPLMDFDGDPELVRSLFGTATAWESMP